MLSEPNPATMKLFASCVVTEIVGFAVEPVAVPVFPYCATPEYSTTHTVLRTLLANVTVIVAPVPTFDAFGSVPQSEASVVFVIGAATCR